MQDWLKVALYPLSSPNHNFTKIRVTSCLLRYILFHHQTTTTQARTMIPLLLRYILFHHQTTTYKAKEFGYFMLRYILFHHQTTTSWQWCSPSRCCVISSFITKPQLAPCAYGTENVALYPLSSPNHNVAAVLTHEDLLRYILFHHQTTTYGVRLYFLLLLRYILFHHQTTTARGMFSIPMRCVISSFITKPQLLSIKGQGHRVALYPLSSPNHNVCDAGFSLSNVALYPLSSPNHNLRDAGIDPSTLRYILFHHQTTTCISYVL